MADRKTTRAQHVAPWPMLDLRNLSAASAIQTTITVRDFWIEDRSAHSWIELGAVSIIGSDRPQGIRRWQLKGWLGRNATDREHDAAQVIRLPLLCVQIAMVMEKSTWLDAIIDPSIDVRDGDRSGEFRVPAPGWDPFAAASTCTSCKKRHPITEYLPPFDAALYEMMRGKQVQIVMRNGGEDQ